jgi:thiol peroxidase
MSNRTVTLREQSFTLLGTPVAVGDKAQDVTLADGMTTTFRLLGDTAGKTRLISVVPSIDTGICDLQTRRMNEEAATLGDNVIVLTVSGPCGYGLW